MLWFQVALMKLLCNLSQMLRKNLRQNKLYKLDQEMEDGSDMTCILIQRYSNTQRK